MMTAINTAQGTRIGNLKALESEQNQVDSRRSPPLGEGENGMLLIFISFRLKTIKSVLLRATKIPIENLQSLKHKEPEESSC